MLLQRGGQLLLCLLLLLLGCCQLLAQPLSLLLVRLCPELPDGLTLLLHLLQDAVKRSQEPRCATLLARGSTLQQPQR